MGSGEASAATMGGMPERWRIALVVIARDEAPRIGRLLASVAPFVDAMHVLDTGSSDGTPEVAAAHGAQVSHLPWPGDFAAARNVALERAGADWHLVLDADEWLEAGGEHIADLRRCRPDFVGVLQLHDRLGGDDRASSWLSRVFPGALRYQGRVHEQVAHALPRRRLAVRIGHDGYLPQRLAHKRGRNHALLQQALADAPDDAYLWYQLGKDHGVFDEHAPAHEALARAAQIAGAESAPWWPDLVVRRLIALNGLKRHAEGMDLAEAERERCAQVPDFFFALGDLLLDLAADEPANAGLLLPMIEAAWRRCLEIGERPDLPQTVPGRGSWSAAHNLALVLEGTGRGGEAQALRAAHPKPTPQP